MRKLNDDEIAPLAMSSDQRSAKKEIRGISLIVKKKCFKTIECEAENEKEQRVKGEERLR